MVDVADGLGFVVGWVFEKWEEDMVQSLWVWLAIV